MGKKRAEPEKSVDTEEESAQEEEEASFSDDKGGSDSEPEPPSTKKRPKKPEPSSEESDSESEADSDSNPKAATTPTKKHPTKSAAGTKRPAAAANGEAKESKKSKKKPSGEVKKSVTQESKKKAVAEIENSAKTEDPKKQLFQRLWSEEDEIAVLKGMIEYAEEKNADPVADLNAFHDYIRESLQIDVNRSQLQDKIRRLRKKYENNACKETKGKERTFMKRHDQNAYDLSKKIWGRGAAAAQNGSGVVKAGESSKLANNKVEVLDEKKNMDVDMNVEGYKSLNSIGGSLFGKSLDELSEWIEKNKGYVSEEEMIEMEEKWKALKITEVELFLKRAKLIYEQGKLVLDALKKK